MSWKAAESRIGIFYGAKGIMRSGRQPLSGGNSGVTRGDAPHPTIFIESKRDKKYHSAIKLWRDYKKNNKGKLIVLSLPTVEDGKVISNSSDIWCIHNLDLEKVANIINKDNADIEVFGWRGHYPSALSLYEDALAIRNSSKMDIKREIVTCNLVYHGHRGFWVIINRNDIAKCWELILEAREIRNKLLAEEGLGVDNISRNPITGSSYKLPHLGKQGL